ncbi:MAG: chemotaxis protein CheW [Cyanobacteria bacterium P01_H01_bin.121]
MSGPASSSTASSSTASRSTASRSTAATPTSRLQQLLPQLFQAEQAAGDRYLKLDVVPTLTVLIDLADVQESVQVPMQMVTPLPNLPAHVLGLLNSRNQVLAVVDLARLLQIPARRVYRQEYSLITLRINPAAGFSDDVNLLAIAVAQIHGIIRLQPNELQPPRQDFPAQLTPFLQGYVSRDEEQLPILNLANIRITP